MMDLSELSFPSIPIGTHWLPKTERVSYDEKVTGTLRIGVIVCTLVACGVVGVEELRPDTSDSGMSDVGAPDAGASDAGASDAGISDAGISDAGALDAGERDAASDAPTVDATGSCGPVTDVACPNETVFLDSANPTFEASGITFGGLANSIDSPCFPAGGSDWSLLVETGEDGRIVPTIRGGSVAVAFRNGSCAGESDGCSNPVPSSSSYGMAAGRPRVIAIESIDSCGTPFDITIRFEAS